MTTSNGGQRAACAVIPMVERCTGDLGPDDQGRTSPDEGRRRRHAESMGMGEQRGGPVVVGFDGSESSKDAARWAAHHARATGRSITILMAVEPPVMAGSVGMGLPVGFGAVDEWREQARTEATTAAHELGLDDAVIDVEIGSPSAVLVDRSSTASMVVLGSRGRGGFAELLLGSVGAQVAPHAWCPVVVVRAMPAGDKRAAVVGVDGSDESRAALDFAFREASAQGWSVIAVHAWNVPSYELLAVPQIPVPIPLQDFSDDEVRLSAEALAGFREQFPDVSIEERLVRGDAASALLDAGTDASLIVVGSRGHGPAMGALLGSVSHEILHRAQTPVAVVSARSRGRAA